MENIVASSEYHPTSKLTTAYMSIFELAALITTRAQEIEDGRGPEPIVDMNLCESPIDAATLEIRSLKPEDDYHLCIQRVLPTGQKEFWRVSEMFLPN